MKRTIAIQNPCKLNVERSQLVIKREGETVGQIPIEDLAVVILEHRQITLTQAVFSKALEHNVAIVTCSADYYPSGLLLNLQGHHLQRKLFEKQLTASLPLQKQLWQQIVRQKLMNQARVLETVNQPSRYVEELSTKVKSGDTGNCEALGANHYWRHLFGEPIVRERGGAPPNNYLNYGYAILRAMTARALVGAGLLPTWGIHHRNQYNAFCLADDIMEPYRPLVDLMVLENFWPNPPEELTTEEKKVFWSMATRDCQMPAGKRPLQQALAETASSLQQCFTKQREQISLPDVITSL